MPDDLKELRDEYSYYLSEWQEVRTQAELDMKCLDPLQGPWDPAERKQREDPEHRRPVLVLDEIHQYLNQLVNDVRLNPRAIKITPEGEGANDETARLRQARIRQIEYKSNAQSAYTTAFQGAAERSYGFFRINRKYINDESFDQELCIRRIPNPDTVLIDPDYKEADASDMRGAYVLDIMPVAQYKKRFPKAKIASFTAEHMLQAPAWIKEKTIQVAERWVVKSKYRKRLLLADNSIAWADELQGKSAEVRREREVEIRDVFQQITNGLEILEELDWKGQWIPVVPVFGKEMWISKGGESKRHMLSLVRLARDPYMLYCYYRSCEAEIAGSVPKIPYIGYEGQFDTQTPWAQINKIPVAYAEVKPMLDATGQAVLPLPRREVYEPPIQAMELGAESARRAIQAAMGMYNSSVGKRDTSAMSGKMLDSLERQSDQGSYHFIDSYNIALAYAGRILNEQLSKTEDTSRDVGLRKDDDSYEIGHIDVQSDNEGNVVESSYGTGKHEVTVSTGPSFQSQREEVNDFGTILVRDIDKLPLAPEQKAQLVALVIKLKNLGPLGDQMAEILSPSKDKPLDPRALQALQQAKDQLQSLDAYAKQLEQQMSQMKQQLDGKVLEQRVKIELAKLEAQTKITIAQISSKAQEANERIKWEMESARDLGVRAHEAGLQASEQAHQVEMADRQGAQQIQMADMANQQQQMMEQPAE